MSRVAPKERLMLMMIHSIYTRFHFVSVCHGTPKLTSEVLVAFGFDVFLDHGTLLLHRKVSYGTALVFL